MSVKRVERLDGPRYIVEWKNDRRQTRNKTFTRKADADAFDAKVKLGKRTGDLADLDAGKEPFSDFASDWLRLHAERHLSEKTMIEYRRYLAADVLPAFGHVSLRRITPLRVEEFSAKLTDDGRGAATVRKILGMLQGMFERAIAWGRIKVNPVKPVRKPSARRAQPIRALSPETVEGLRSRVPTLRDRTLISVIAYGGLRPGEVLALTWADIQDRTIIVSKAVSLGSEKDTKTARHRSVPMLQPLAKDLTEWRIASGCPAASALVFPSSAQTHWQDHDYRNWRNRIFKAAATALGLLNARPYDLRHSAASLLFQEGRNPAEIAELMGHSLQTLFDNYTHVIQELRGTERVSAEELIRLARDPARPVPMKLKKTG